MYTYLLYLYTLCQLCLALRTDDKNGMHMKIHPLLIGMSIALYICRRAANERKMPTNRAHCEIFTAVAKA